MTPGGRWVAGLALGALILAGLGFAGQRWLGLTLHPEAELIAQLKAGERRELLIPIRGEPAPLMGSRHRFQRISVHLSPDEPTARIVATLDFRGSLEGTRVGALALEQVRFLRRGGRWEPEAGEAPTLGAIVSALAARRRALEEGDVEALAALVEPEDREAALADRELATLLSVEERRYQVSAWYLRSERDEVRVTEEYRLTGRWPEQPVDQTGRRSLVLVPRDGEFSFRSGLM